MRILVCVKQVPGTTKVEIDPVTGNLKRDGVESKLNPYDLFALEAAYQLAEKHGGSVVTLSMGPNQAIPALLETVYMGAEHSYLLSDRKFAGSDVQATSYAISQGIRKAGRFDLILCGKQTTDGDTAQVGPEVAEMLGIDHATNVKAILAADEEKITVAMDMDGWVQTQEMDFPCLLTIDKDAYTPRLPSYKRKKETPADAVTVWTAADLADLDENRCGQKGSPTQVERIFPPEKNAHQTLHEGDGATLAEELFTMLREEKFI